MKVSGLNKYKENCYAALSRDLTEFEKNFLLIAGGILAFSITFIKDIIKVSEANYLYLLFISWILIIFSIGLMMHTFLKSANASDSLWNLVDNFLMDNSLYADETDLTSDQWLSIKKDVKKIFDNSKFELRKLRKLAVNIFLIGLTVFSIFISINLFRENLAGKQNKNTVTNVDSNLILKH